MSKGFLIFAENKDNIDYVRQAYTLALSIHATQKNTNVSLITNECPTAYKTVFDEIIPIPWYDQPGSKLSAEHRWKMYYATPYEETIVLDADMLMLEDVTAWWEYCKDRDIIFCNKIKNYKLDPIQDTSNRKAFIVNNLTSPYFAFHYFKKNDIAYEFYKGLEFVCKNWQWSWTKFAPKEYQSWCSMDLATAVTIEMLQAYYAYDNLCPFEIIHMRTNLQGWADTESKWTGIANYILNSKGDFLINNIKQSKVLHYIEKDFCTDDLISRLKELGNGT